MHQIYGRTPIAKCNFNKAAHPQGFAIQVCWSSRLNLLKTKTQIECQNQEGLGLDLPKTNQIEFPSKGDRGV